MDHNRTMLDVLVRTIQDRYSDSVSLAFVYGSYVTGETGPKSDLDVLIIGRDERAFELQRGFVFQGIGYDFWCMLEGRMQRIVAEFQPLVSIFAQGRLVYARSPRARAVVCFAAALPANSQGNRVTHQVRQADRRIARQAEGACL